MLIQTTNSSDQIERRLVCRWIELTTENQTERLPYFAINNGIKLTLSPFVRDLRYTETYYAQGLVAVKLLKIRNL